MFIVEAKPLVGDQIDFFDKVALVVKHKNTFPLYIHKKSVFKLSDFRDFKFFRIQNDV